MSLPIIIVLTLGAAAYVMYPLLRPGGHERPGPALAAADSVVVDGVAYRNEEEWAMDRALGKVGDGEPGLRAHRARVEAEAEIERQVAELLAARRKARASSRRVLCPGCKKPFQAGDRFCPRCGEAHPNTCLHCGERQRPGDRYCTRCGTALPGGG